MKVDLAIVGQGSLFALSDNKYIGGHGGDQISLGLGLRVADDWITASGIDWNWVVWRWPLYTIATRLSLAPKSRS